MAGGQAEVGGAYGWRARIGFLQPAVANPNHPHEFYLMVPDGVTISIVSLRSLDDPEGEFLSDESLRRPLTRIPLAVKVLVEQPVDVIVQAGIPHIAIEDWGYEDKLSAEVAAITDLPFVIDMRSSIDAMRALQMVNVLMVSPFTERPTAKTVEYIANAGINVVATHRVKVADYGGLYSIALSSIYDEAKKAFEANSKVDGIWMPGAAMPSVGAIAALEQDLGIPVVSSKQAMVWAALSAVRVDEPVRGYGRLFTHDSA